MPAAWSHEVDTEIFEEDITKHGKYVVGCLDTPGFLQDAWSMCQKLSCHAEMTLH